VEFRSEAPVGGLGDEVPQKLKHYRYADNCLPIFIAKKRSTFENFRTKRYAVGLIIILDQSVSRWGLSDILRGA